MSWHRKRLGLSSTTTSGPSTLLGLVRENEGVAARILLDFDADSEKIRTEVIRMVPSAPRESSSSEGGAPEARSDMWADEPLAAPSSWELGWRGRPIALAALGAAVLARLAFDPCKTGQLEALGMQVLARLMLGPPDAALAEPGELVDSLATALACDHDDLHQAVRVLSDQQLVNCREEQDGDERITITAAGMTMVESWLAHTAPLFGRWPPDDPAADDAIT